MKKKILISLSFLGFFIALAQENPFVGLWQAIDEETGKAKSEIRIFEKNAKLYGVIERLFVKPTNPNCVKCSDDRKNKPLIGLEIIRDLKKDDNSPVHYKDGSILDPKNGKVYKLKIYLEDGGKTLKVRGSFLFISRTQTWKRIK